MCIDAHQIGIFVVVFLIASFLYGFLSAAFKDLRGRR